MTLRRFIFWLHLVAGLIAGLSIGIMCFTGTVLAFEKELIAWSERDLRRIDPPAPGAERLPLDALHARLLQAHPDARPASIVVQRDPLAAVAFTSGRAGGYYVNPYTGDARPAVPGRMSAFMRTMTDLHRTLGFRGEESRVVGKMINGVCNLAYFVLALTGLYLWMPRRWSWTALRPVIWFRGALGGRARDFNWHNTIGFWTAPIVIVLTLTAVPISFRWGGDFIYWITGTPAPAAESRASGGSAPAVDLPVPAPGVRPMSTEALVASVQQREPAWKTVTYRLPGAPASASASQAVTFTVRSSGSWPRTANTTLQLDPFTGAVVRRTGHDDLNAAQRVRGWTRFLHTGEALGKVAQAVAGLACLGGVFLVYTGFTLSWRRFFSRRSDLTPGVDANGPG